MKNADIVLSDETYAINRCVDDVYDAMPRFAEEAIYQKALEIALADAGAFRTTAELSWAA